MAKPDREFREEEKLAHDREIDKTKLISKQAKINEEIPDCPYSPERFGELVRELFGKRGFTLEQTEITTGTSKSTTIGGAVITTGSLAGGAAKTTTTHTQLTWNPFKFRKQDEGMNNWLGMAAVKDEASFSKKQGKVIITSHDYRLLAELEYSNYSLGVSALLVVIGLIAWIFSHTVGIVVIAFAILMHLLEPTLSEETLKERTKMAQQMLDQIITELKQSSRKKNAEIRRR